MEGQENKLSQVTPRGGLREGGSMRCAITSSDSPYASGSRVRRTAFVAGRGGKVIHFHTGNMKSHLVGVVHASGRVWGVGIPLGLLII